MKLDDTFYLGRAGRYSNPANSNDRLPIVYGALTDGSAGIWRLPCIDTVNHVYCYADHEVMGAAEGNSVAIYADGVLVSSGYTFDESDDYESKGRIAKITFTSDQGNAKITARGKGKGSSGALIENPIDILNDFLTVENDFDSGDYDATRKATARAVAAAAGYKCAGTIHQDVVILDLLQQIMGSFLGSVWLTGAGKLALEIDNGTIQYTAKEILPKADMGAVKAVQRIENLINQCPCSYGYNYADLEFRLSTDSAGAADAASQGIYGVRKPSSPYQFYWCRDLTTVQAVQAIIVAKFARPVWQVEIEDLTLRRAHLEVGDVIAATIDLLYDDAGDQCINQLFKVVGVGVDLENNKIVFSALDTGAYLTVAQLADGSYDADGTVVAGGKRDPTIY